MKNNLMKVEDEFQEENEINIYEIINIFIRNIKMFFWVTILGLIVTCFYIGVRVVFFKNNVLYINYTLNYEEMNSYIGNNIYYPKKNPKEILLDNKYIDLLFENPELKALYEEKIKEDRDSIDTKRQFLTNNKILETFTLKELNKDAAELISSDSYRTIVRVNRKNDVGRNVSNSIMATYLEILKQYYKEKMFDYLLERKQYLEKTLPLLKKQLEENTVSTQVLVSGGGSGSVDNNYFKYLYPIEVSNIDTYYEKYKTLETEYQSIKTLFDLELNKAETFIKYDSSIIIEKEKSGNMTKLLIGVALSICLGVITIFIKEFIEGYKKLKK